MITDKLTILSGAVSAAGAVSGQAIAAASVVSTNAIDTGPRTIGANQPADLGVGEEIDINVSVLTAPTAATSIQFSIIQADDAALTSNVQVLVSTPSIAIASLPVGTLVPLSMRSAAPLAPKRYIGLRYDVTGTNTSAGTYFASVVADQAYAQRNYKSGFTVS